MHVNQCRIQKSGSKHEAKGHDGCRVDSRLRSKYSELFRYPNQEIEGSIDFIHQVQFDLKGPISAETVGLHYSAETIGRHYAVFDPTPN